MSSKLIKAYPRFLNSDIQYCKTGAPPTRSSDWDPTYFITGQTGVFWGFFFLQKWNTVNTKELKECCSQDLLQEITRE